MKLNAKSLGSDLLSVAREAIKEKGKAEALEGVCCGVIETVQDLLVALEPLSQKRPILYSEELAGKTVLAGSMVAVLIATLAEIHGVDLSASVERLDKENN